MLLRICWRGLVVFVFLVQNGGFAGKLDATLFIHADSYRAVDPFEQSWIDDLKGDADFVVANPPASRTGDGLDLRPSGFIGSLVGALIVTAGWQWWSRKQRRAERAAS